MSNFPWWVHWIACGMLSSGLWCVVMLFGFIAIGFPRKRERELERLVKELEEGRRVEDEVVTSDQTKKYEQGLLNAGITVPEKEKGGSVPISELGWTKEQAVEARARLSAFAPFWDDPSMDVYNDE